MLEKCVKSDQKTLEKCVKMSSKMLEECECVLIVNNL